MKGKVFVENCEVYRFDGGPSHIPAIRPPVRKKV